MRIDFKIFLFLVLLILMSLKSFSQLDYVGLSGSYIKGYRTYSMVDYISYDTPIKFSNTLSYSNSFYRLHTIGNGICVNYKIANSFHFQPEINLVRRGVEYKMYLYPVQSLTNGDQNSLHATHLYEFYYLSVPVKFGNRFNYKKVAMEIQGGVEGAFFLKGQHRYTVNYLSVTHPGFDQQLQDNGVSKNSFNESVKGKFTLGVVLGVVFLYELSPRILVLGGGSFQKTMTPIRNFYSESLQQNYPLRTYEWTLSVGLGFRINAE